MHAADLHSSTRKLQDALRTLLVHWDATKDQWDDAVRHEFDKKYIAPLEPRVRATLERLNRVAQTVTQARQECS